nr:MAG TPA: hypothetical protein [Caudoviricetes sp.]
MGGGSDGQDVGPEKGPFSCAFTFTPKTKGANHG